MRSISWKRAPAGSKATMTALLAAASVASMTSAVRLRAARAGSNQSSTAPQRQENSRSESR
jgi:hypothetical protein